MLADELPGFLERWLRAWTGNDPAGLLEFYSDDIFYSDPHLREGVQGKERLRGYLSKLLAANPEWVWTLVEAHAFDGGCAVKWRARIPAGDELIEAEGLDLVEMKDGKIIRNEVYFDPTPLLRATGRM